MTKFFFERYRPEICRGLHNWCCKRILRRFRLFQGRKFFLETFQFFDYFCISGVTDFLKNDYLFLRDTGLKFIVDCKNDVSNEYKGILGWFERKKNLFEGCQFFYIFAYQGSQISLQMTTSFLRDSGLKFIVDCTNGVANECYGVLGSFKEKDFIPSLPIFWIFLHIWGHIFLEKWLTPFLRDAGLKLIEDITNCVTNTC